MTTTEMEYAISRKFDVRSHIIVPNISWGLLNHEADVLVVRVNSGYCLEFEIKRTFADYKKDFGKAKWRGGLSKAIKEFTYVFPAKLYYKRKDAILALLPEFAGVLLVHDEDGRMPYADFQINAKTNPGAIPLSEAQKFKVAHLGTMRIWSLKYKLILKRNEKIRLNQRSERP